MRILLISSAFNSMTQRFYVELGDNGHEVAVELYGGSENLLKESVCLYAPDLIIAPFLTRAIPEEIWGRHICIIVHPGVEGDRGPSSLDWAIQEGWKNLGRNAIASCHENGRWPDFGEQNISFTSSPQDQHLSTRNNRSGGRLPVGGG